jgi:hypothetical protein
MSSKFYTGIGSRETPDSMLVLIRTIGEALARQGWGLRSGGAIKADTAFDQGALAGQGKRAIYLPELPKPHSPRARDPAFISPADAFGRLLWQDAMDLAAYLHKGWDHLDDYARCLMARNVFQVLGDDLNTPSKFVICWAPKSKLNERGECINVAGGTGLAVRLAAHVKVPVFNLDLPQHRLQIERGLLKMTGVAPPAVVVPTVRGRSLQP